MLSDHPHAGSPRPSAAAPASRLLPAGGALFALAISAAAAPPNFRDDVEPLFRKHCLNCHNPDKRKGDLDLTSVKALQLGSSGGEVVKAGVPDTSVLLMSIEHEDGIEPMPPRKPQLSAADRKVIRDWIAGGLLATEGGESQLRELAFEVGAGSAEAPEEPALPVGLPEIPLAETSHAPPVIAMAASPWADLVAVGRNEQIVLHGRSPAPNKMPEFQPVAATDLVSRQLEEAVALKTPIVDEKTPAGILGESGAFTFAAWIRPDQEPPQPILFGRASFHIMLERTRDGWRTRSFHRDAKNGQLYGGRVGEFSAGILHHVAVTSDGEELAYYYDGVEIHRQEIPEANRGHLTDERPFQIGGIPEAPDRNFQGEVRDVRLYRRALSPEEIARILANARPGFEPAGVLPFPHGIVQDLRFSRNGELLLAAGGVGSYSGKVALYNVRTGEVKASLGDEQDVVLSADISADHRFVAIGTTGHRLKLFSTADGSLLHNIEKHTDWVTSVRFSPDGKLVASGDRNGGIHIRESDGGGIVYTLDEHAMKIHVLAWRPDGKVLASGSEDGRIALWDLEDGWPVRTIDAHKAETTNRYTRETGVLDLVFTRSGGLVSIGRDRAARLWSVEGKPAATREDLPALPTRIALRPDGLLVIGDLRGNLTLWRPGG